MNTSTISALETLAARLAPRLRPVVQRLPMQPPALALSLLLNRLLLPRLPADAREALSGKAVEVAVIDIGLALRLQLDAGGFGLAPEGAKPVLRIAAAGPTYWRLLRGEDDADRLFFERALVMEGDTEMGLVLKNTLDAIGPWFSVPARA
ncbi:MAG: SCP2 sterol-binding domain-containing protein [Pseudomonadota bacterium]